MTTVKTMPLSKNGSHMGHNGATLDNLMSNHAYLSPDERREHKLNMLSHFRKNVLNVGVNKFETTKTSHADILTKSFNMQKEGSSQKIKNGNQLWIALESLNYKKAQQKSLEEKTKLTQKRA